MINYKYSSTPVETTAKIVADILKKHLKNNEKVLWLLTGGSGLTVAIKTIESLGDVDLNNLYITLTDERYGKIDHPDENWGQLLNAGFKAPGAKLYRPLIDENIVKTTEQFNNWVSDRIDQVDYKIGIFGIGKDGHTAGIKPGSEAIDSIELVDHFIGNDYERITMTFPALSKLDEAVVQVSGEEKENVLNDLLHKAISPTKQPAQILKTIPKVTLISNVKVKEL